jgi:propionate CoA-transferase
VDIERDILAHMGFAPIVRQVRLMDAGLFRPVWGGLAQAIGAPAKREV